MRHWTYREWVAYACLFVGAMIIAADTSVRLAPDLTPYLPAFVHGPLWGFAPLVLVVSATILLVAHEFTWIGSRTASSKSDTNNQRVPKSDRRAWLSSYKILELADPQLIVAHKAERAKRQNAMQRIQMLADEQRRLERVADGMKLIAATNARTEAEIESKRALDASEKLWSQMWNDIHEKLASGDLVAKGFLTPISENPAEIYIPTAYWRFLRLTDTYSSASGEGKSYIGVAVAKAS